MFELDPAYGLWGLGIYSFLAATLFPGGSELALYAQIRLAPDSVNTALLIATVANTLGGMFSWWCGRFLPRWQRLEKLSHIDGLRRWGSPTLLFAWTPLLGDALCIAAGWLRLHWLPCAVFMALGKGLRYWLVAQAALSN